jgi:hypothetical protein
MATLNFDSTGIDTTNTFDAIPAGDYEVMVTASEMKATKDGTGHYLELTLEVQSGQHQGRKLWDRLNLQNRNPKAVEIAQKQLAQLCHGTGVLQVANSEQLHNRPVVVKVACKADEQRGLVNEIKGYKARAAGNAVYGAPPAPRVATTAPAFAPARVNAAPSAQAAPVMPWARGAAA